jgi:hypothetical protein
MLTTPPARSSIPTTIPPSFSALMPHMAPALLITEDRPCDDVRVTDEVLADQVHYYRRRAGEYFVDPAELELRLRGLGWDCVIRRDTSDWVYGEARLAR